MTDARQLPVTFVVVRAISMIESTPRVTAIPPHSNTELDRALDPKTMIHPRAMKNKKVKKGLKSD